MAKNYVAGRFFFKHAGVQSLKKVIKHILSRKKLVFPAYFPPTY